MTKNGRKTCDACPWRRGNQGKRTPGGWYTKKNLQRLWAKLRHGDSMSCHPTDVRVCQKEMETPKGYRAAPGDTEVQECIGGLVLQQREAMRFQKLADKAGKDDQVVRQYRKARPRGLTHRALIHVIVARGAFGGTIMGGTKMEKPDLNDAQVHYSPLGEWEAM